MKIEQLWFVEAVRAARRPRGIPAHLSRAAGPARAEPGTRSRLLAANKVAAEFYAEQLAAPTTPQKAREFLADRGFDAAAAASFGCGFAPAGWEKLTKHLLGQGFTLEELEKAGPWPAASGARSTGSSAGCCGRSAISAATSSGSARGGSSTTTASRPSTSTPPRRRLPQVEGALRARPGQAGHREAPQAVVVEGYTDVMAMHLAGVPTAVASCGTAFGDDHVAVLRRTCSTRSGPRRGHLHLRRRRRRAEGGAQGVRRRPAVLRADLRRDRTGRHGPLRAAPGPR